MGSGTYYPAASGDDGYWLEDATFSSTSNSIYFGGSDGRSQHIFVRFSNVTIPQGGIIESAFVRFTCWDSESSTPVNTNIHFEDSDNAVAPTDATEADALSLTGGIVWDGLSAWINGTTYDTPELKTILQAVIDRGGFASGQAVMVLIKDDGSGVGAERGSSSYDFDGGSEKAELHVTWQTIYEGILTETATISETLIVGINTEFAEDATIDDALGVAVNPAPLAEAVTIDDALAVDVDTELTEAAALGDELLLSIEAGISEDVTINEETVGTHLIYLSIEETLGIWDTVSPAWGKVIEDTLAFTEVVDKILAIIANDPLTLEEALTVNWTGTEEVESTLQMIGYLICGEIFNETSADTLAFADVSSYLHQMIAAIADTLGLTEALTTQVEFNPAIIEAIALTGLIEVLAHLHNTNEETLTLTDEPGVGWGKTIEDTLAFVDVATPTFFVMAAITDSLAFTEVVLHQFKINESILDTIEFATTLALKQILTSTVEDTLDFGITVKFDDEFWECWVLNTNQFNVSVYSGYDFNSYTVYNDTAFGCKTDGIYKLSGTQDAGNDFVSGIILPETYFGTNRKKRFRKAYFGLSGGSPSIRMETDSGSKTYTITDSKANFSRDLYGRQWTLKIQAFDDLDFIELCPIILAR